MLDRGGVNSLIRLIHTIVNEKLLHFSRGVGGTGTPPIPPETMKNHPLDPDDGPHTGPLTEDDVTLDDATGHDHQGAGSTGKKVTAAKVINVPAGDIAATNVQGALNELDGEKAGLPVPESDITFDDAAGHDHQGAGNTGKKLTAAKVINVPAGGIASTEVQAAIDELDTEKVGTHDTLDGAVHPDTVAQEVTRGSIIVGDATPKWNEKVIGAAETYLRSDGTDPAYAQIPASEVVNTPAGGIAAIDVQAALNELDTEKATKGSVKITLTNETGGERTAGHVVVTDPNHDESFIASSGSGYQGKVLVVADTIADSAGGPCWERGGPFDIDVVGAVSRNDGLRTSGTAYKAEAAPAVVSTGVFAIALSTSGSGGGTIKAVFLDVVSAGGGGNGGDGTVEVQEDDAKVTDARVFNFEGGGGKVTNEGGGKVTIDITPGGNGGGVTDVLMVQVFS